MGRLILIVIAAGIAVGLAWPNDRSPAKTALQTEGGAHEVVLTRGSTGHFFSDATVNGKGSVHFIVDTGASSVALTVEDAHKLGIPVNPAEFEIIGEGASGAVRGQLVTLDSVDLEGIKAQHVPAMVLENSSISLLGQSFLASVDNVNISGDYLTLKDGA